MYYDWTHTHIPAYTCTLTHMNTCTPLHTHIHMHTYTHTHPPHTHMNTFTHTLTHTCICTHTHAHTCMHARTHAHTHTRALLEVTSLCTWCVTGLHVQSTWYGEGASKPHHRENTSRGIVRGKMLPLYYWSSGVTSWLALCILCSSETFFI